MRQKDGGDITDLCVLGVDLQLVGVQDIITATVTAAAACREGLPFITDQGRRTWPSGQAGLRVVAPACAASGGAHLAAAQQLAADGKHLPDMK